MLIMRTTRDIVAIVGSERLQQMLRVGPKSINRAETSNRFTASWARAIDKELIENGQAQLTLDELDTLFSFKKRGETARP